MNRKVWIGLLAVLLVAMLALAGCGKKESTANEEQGSSPAAQPAAGAKIDTSNAGRVTGAVKFDGAAPKPRKIDMSQDPACKGDSASEDVVVDGGNLANAFVYVKSGLPNATFETPTTDVELDQEGCRYHPHVLAVMTGQKVRIKNSDPTTHNVHPTPKENREWNESQAPKAPDMEKTFAREEIMLPVKCNQHPWMKMYINVMKHPYFAVTGTDGKFEIKDLPPGKYTVAVVHEKLGEQTQEITVEANGEAKQDFTYKAGGGAAGSK
jgi:plastocyanin